MVRWAEAQALFSNVWKDDGAKREPDLKKHKYTPDYRAHMEEWVGYLKAAKKTYEGKEPKTLDVDLTLTAKVSTLDAIAFSELVRDVALLSSQ